MDNFGKSGKFLRITRFSTKKPVENNGENCGKVVGKLGKSEEGFVTIALLAGWGAAIGAKTLREAGKRLTVFPRPRCAGHESWPGRISLKRND